MRPPSIRTQISVTLNILVLAVSIAIGWCSLQLTSGILHRQLLTNPTNNFAQLINKMNLPLTDRLMSQISDVMESEVMIVSPESEKVICSSLRHNKGKTVARQLKKTKNLTTIALGDSRYRAGKPARVSGRQSRNLSGENYLVMLMPQAKWISEKRSIWTRILIVTLCSLAVATLAGVLIADKIARPIRTLVGRMDHFSPLARPDSDFSRNATRTDPMGAISCGNTSQQTAGAWDRESSEASDGHAFPSPPLASNFPECQHSPAEVQHLSASFQNLLKRLRESQENLESAAKLATTAQLSAAVAHEIRNPLGGIKMNIHVLQETLAVDSDPKSREVVEHILKNIDRIDLFVQELMHMDTDEQTEITARENLSRNPATVSLPEIFHNVRTLLEPKCRQAAITLTEDFPPEASRVYGDAEEIRQVILNLLLNGIEAVEAREGALHISARRLPSGYIRYSIADNGPGVAEEAEQHVFEPLVTTKKHGTGLGLFVCKRIIEKNHGSIGYNQLEAGTEFWFQLPGAQNNHD